MSYIFRGSLCGRLCSECLEQLSDVIVRLYRNRTDQNVTALAVASPNDTLALLTDEQIKAKTSQLIAETTTDAEGNFSFTLGREQDYAGGSFEVDVYCGTVPHRKPGRKPTPPRQFSITTLQPAWKRTGENDFMAIWDYCVPNRFWCHIRSLFDAWVICGHLTSCLDGAPIPGATVSATDVDWIQDDPLGSAVTDATGHFRIDYTAEDFMVTPLSPFLNFELVGGPDIYFKAMLGTVVILDEPRSKGRTPGRENIGPCFCVELCSDKVTGGGCGVSCDPHWQKVWDINIHPDAGQVGSQFSAEGYAGGAAASWVFGDMNIRQGVMLRGNCPLINPAVPANKLQYRFVIGEYTWPLTQDDPTVIPSVPPATLVPVTQIVKTTVGWVFYIDANGITSSADVDIHPVDLDADGWVSPILGRVVSVDMHDGNHANVTITETNFLRTDELMVMNSAVITAAHPPKLPGGLPQTEAGRALTNAEKEPIRRYKLQFQVRDVVLGPLPAFTDTLSSIILNNSTPILALDMEELFLNLCNPLAGVNTAHLLYTADHPHLSSFNLTISNNIGVVHAQPAPGGPMPSASFPPGGFFFRGGNSGPHNGTFTGGFPVDVSADPSCAYRVNLNWSTRHYPQAWGSDKPEILYCR